MFVIEFYRRENHNLISRNNSECIFNRRPDTIKNLIKIFCSDIKYNCLSAFFVAVRISLQDVDILNEMLF